MPGLFTVASGEKPSVLKAAANSILAAVLIVGFFWVSLSRIDYRLDFSFLPDFRIRIWDGFLLTVGVSLASMVLSLIFGALSAAASQSRFLPIRYFSSAYVIFIRGTPLIMQIYLFFYLVGTAWGVDDRFWAGVIILSVFQGAYISEILRGSYLSLDPAQLESARVIIPQMTARTLPALAGQFASVIKDSSLLSMISVVELTQAMREISATNLKLVESYLFLGILYLILTIPVAYASRVLEKRFSYAA